MMRVLMIMKGDMSQYTYLCLFIDRYNHYGIIHRITMLHMSGKQYFQVSVVFIATHHGDDGFFIIKFRESCHLSTRFQ
jgi:hypothetical protein